MTPERKLLTTTSASASSRRSTALPSSVRVSTEMLRLFRLMDRKIGLSWPSLSGNELREMSPAPGRSTLMMSAP